MSNKSKITQFLRFCMVGLGNTAVDFSAFFLLNLVGVPYLFAQVLSYSAGIINSFFINRIWTFRMKSKANSIEATKFIIVNALSLAISASLLYFLHDVNQLDLWIAKVAATAGGIVVNFSGSKLWVFTESQPITGDAV